MRTLLTSRSGQLGGMELRMGDEARFLAGRGHTCLLAPSTFKGRDEWLTDLIASTPGSQTFDFEPPPFVEEWRLRRLNYIRARALWLPRLRRAQVELAHIFYAWTLEGGSRLWLCSAADIPSVLSIHNAFPHEQLLPWHDRLMRQAFTGVRGLYAVSESALTYFLKTYEPYIRPDTVVEVIPNFVDVARFEPSQFLRESLRLELGIPEDAFVIGSVGRIDTQKQPFQVLDVFDRVASRHPNTHLIFCGQGPLETQVRIKAAEYSWHERVHFLGFRRDVEAVFPALDVHILLSKQEGFGIATAEAMACGVPVVVTDVPGSRDVIGNSACGLLVPFANADAAVNAIVHYMDYPQEAISAGQLGRQRAIQQYSSQKWESRLENFYSRIRR